MQKQTVQPDRVFGLQVLTFYELADVLPKSHLSVVEFLDYLRHYLLEIDLWDVQDLLEDLKRHQCNLEIAVTQ